MFEGTEVLNQVLNAKHSKSYICRTFYIYASSTGNLYLDFAARMTALGWC